jgi:iron(III) transport system ATP-binding protein
MRVVIENLVKNFGETQALKSLSFEICDHELFFLLGPSGCGKTTLLRTIAGFYQPDGGRLVFGEKNMAGIPPHQRNTGMVFQNYALWPHMTVAENVAYGLEVRSVSRAEREQRVRDALDIVQMGIYAERTPNQLSGGQQQRVALARALVVKPDVLLLDEPLSNLDAKLRLEMRDEIRRIHDRTRITTIYVTHDQKEALSLADRMAVLRDGRVEQIGDPRSVYRRPANKFVADFIGETNWIDGTVESISDQGMAVRTAFGTVTEMTRDGFLIGQKVSVGIRPEAVRIGDAPVNAFDARIDSVTYLGEIEQYRLDLGGVSLKAFEQNPLEIRRVGAAVRVHVRPEDVLVFG